LSACDRCGGTGFEIVSRDGREFAQPCACRRPDSGGAGLAAACRIPPRYEHCTFATFEPGAHPTARSAVTDCMRFCAGYPYLGRTDEGVGLLFMGPSGVGKTHLAVAVLQELATTKGARGQFWDFHSLIREIKNSYNPETRTTELQVLEPVIDIDVLLLDDLGAWKLTDWMLDTLFYILNGRYMAKRSTLITTNFQDAPPEVARKDDSPRRREYLVERIGSPLRSRLMEMSVIINVAGDDYRQNRRDANRHVVLGGERPGGSAR